jgi:RimJ/RimL family protein N-acetyltransferase
MLRSFQRKDLEFILAVRNQPDVIKVSNRRRPLDMSELPDPFDGKHLVWIICQDDVDYGYITVEMEDDGRATIGIALVKEARGRGLGTASIQEACSFCFQDGVREVIAEIFSENLVSQGAFKKAGFKLSEEVITPDGRRKCIYKLRAPMYT